MASTELERLAGQVAPQLVSQPPTSLGRQILALFKQLSTRAAVIESTIADVVVDPQDETMKAGLVAQVKAALRDDAVLTEQVRNLFKDLPATPPGAFIVTVTNSPGTVAGHGNNVTYGFDPRRLG